jgi:hypothetical protein
LQHDFILIELLSDSIQLRGIERIYRFQLPPAVAGLLFAVLSTRLSYFPSLFSSGHRHARMRGIAGAMRAGQPGQRFRVSSRTAIAQHTAAQRRMHRISARRSNFPRRGSIQRRWAVLIFHDDDFAQKSGGETPPAH